MSILSPSILVIDDNERDGLAVVKSLWLSGYAAMFLTPESLPNFKKKKGIRIIFMDIDFIGTGIPSADSRYFTPIENALKNCLAKKNGPYVLITWSLHDKFAEDLFEHLNNRLPANLKPQLCKRLDKENFTIGDDVNPEITRIIKKYINELESIQCLMDWENIVHNAASDTSHELIRISTKCRNKEPKAALKVMLYSLIQAEAGKSPLDRTVLPSLHSVMTNILYDRVSYSPLSAKANKCIKILLSTNDTLDGKWYGEVNYMLHIDNTPATVDVEPSPGDVFIYPGTDHKLPIPNKDTGKLIRGNFIYKIGNVRTADKPKIKSKCKLLLIEITPPCDFVNNKFTWNRYIVAASIPADLIKYACLMDPKSDERLENKYPEYIWVSPEFKNNNKASFHILFNSRMIVSIPPKLNDTDRNKLGKRIFRIRSSMLGDMMGWLARQNSRIGHVSVK